nr:SH3 domain-containing protein [Candidatus Woesebacteria bacterium]
VQPTPSPSPIVASPATTPVAGEVCHPILTPGLAVGGYGEVLTSGVNLRETPGGARRGVLRNGQQFRVVGGPTPIEYLGICFHWWQIQTTSGDVGWIAEGSRWRLVGPSTAAG